MVMYSMMKPIMDAWSKRVFNPGWISLDSQGYESVFRDITRDKLKCRSLSENDIMKCCKLNKLKSYLIYSQKNDVFLTVKKDNVSEVKNIELEGKYLRITADSGDVMMEEIDASYCPICASVCQDLKKSEFVITFCRECGPAVSRSYTAYTYDLIKTKEKRFCPICGCRLGLNKDGRWVCTQCRTLYAVSETVNEST